MSRADAGAHPAACSMRWRTWRGTGMTGPCRRGCCPGLPPGRGVAGLVSAGSEVIPEIAPSALW